jgi:tRNA (adenine57-N1/adenine58-N1)-methyltransferase
MKNEDVTLGIEEREVDAVVLDLATPWLVAPHAYKALKDGGSLASFSPTIEQVVKTVEALEKEGFVVLDTIECIVRRMKVKRDETRPERIMVGHTGYMTFAKKIMRNHSYGASPRL